MKKILKIIGSLVIFFLIVLIFLVLTPFLFREKFESMVKTTANKMLATEMNFSEMEVSFFHHFPHLTIGLSDFTLKSSAPFGQDTLISAKDISFGIDLASLFKGPIRITKVYLNRGRVVVQYNEEGRANYNVYQTIPDSLPAEELKDTSSVAAIKIEYIVFTKTDFIYSDPSIPLKMIAHGINYHGKSEMLDGNILQLMSRVQIDSVDLYYNQTPYIASKPVTANLTTNINMKSLDMVFEKNKLFIKDVPFEFKGELNFRKDRYEFFISLFSMYGEEYLSGSVWMVSSNTLWLSAKADVKITLENWATGFGVEEMDLRGLFSMKFKAQGEYSTGQNPASQKPDTIILSIPDISITTSLNRGYFKYARLPQAMSDITFNLNASTSNHNIESVQVNIDNLKAAFLQNKLEGYFRLTGLKDFPVECKILTHLNLADFKQVVPLDNMEIQGLLDLDLNVKGNYAPEKKLFPVAIVSLNLADGAIQTKYYPRPLEKINLSATIHNSTGVLAGTSIKIDPLSLSFEDNPFEFRGEIVNPENISYSIVSKGSVDLAGIYHLFSREGMDLSGYISTDLVLKGKQSDAMNGHYERLHNSGKLVLREIAFSSQYLPKPFILKSGVFRFENDKIWFEKFQGQFGESDITMDGYLNNVINYALTDNQPLKGNFKFHSDYLLVDEFMTECEKSSVEISPSIKTGKASEDDSAVARGVVIIPENLEIDVNAAVKKIRFQKLDIHNLKGSVEIQKGMLLLKELLFDLIGCKVGMEATYGSINPEKAFFDFHVRAQDFDVKRAYNEVDLFRNLSTSAGKCEGIVSLDYSLKGRLDAGMKPVYPSLEGGGVLSLKKVKVMGLKLFTALSKNLEKEKIKNPDLSRVELKTTIKNNVIRLEKTKMKMAGFRFKIEGETNFNGRLNLKARLGLPPLGIVGIPIRVLGTHDNPKFKYGRGNNDENVEETVYSDEIPPDILEKVKNAKEEDIRDDPQ